MNFFIFTFTRVMSCFRFLHKYINMKFYFVKSFCTFYNELGTKTIFPSNTNILMGGLKQGQGTSILNNFTRRQKSFKNDFFYIYFFRKSKKGCKGNLYFSCSKMFQKIINKNGEACFFHKYFYKWNLFEMYAFFCLKKGNKLIIT